MATAILDIINDACLFAGIGDQFNPLDANSVALALRVANRLWDSWSTEELTIFGKGFGTFPLISGTAAYTIGPGFSLGLRPPQVDKVTIVDAQNVTHAVKQIGGNDWAGIAYKPAAGRPEYFVTDTNFPTSSWQFWPTPSIAGDVVNVYYWQPMQAFVNLTDAIIAPPGYGQMFVCDLGCALAPYHKVAITPDMLKQTSDARHKARHVNSQPKTLTVEIPTGPRHSYNIFSDQV